MMYEKPKYLIWWRILAAVVLIAVLAVGGVLLFKAGYAQGALVRTDGDLALPDFGPFDYHMPMRGYHFFPGNIFFGLLFFFIIFGLIKKIIFGPRWGYRMHPMGRFPGMNWKEGAEKWHAEMHERMATPESETETDQPSGE